MRTTGRRRRGFLIGFVSLCAAVLMAITAPGSLMPVAAAESTSVVSPPASIVANCSSDVSKPMQHWLRSLSAGTTVIVPASACYQLDHGVRLYAANGLIISGGTWEDDTSPPATAEPYWYNPVFWFAGGSGITVEDLTITGVNPGGYHVSGAFMAGIRSDGVIGLVVANVSIEDVYGDGLQLNALRNSNDTGGDILNPTENAAISDVQIQGAGRQGITMESVDGVTVSSVQFSQIGFDAFDLEAGQSDEGAWNVTIDGCTDVGGDGGLFFANGGAGAGGKWTGDITVENCIMEAAEAGDAVLVQSPPGVGTPRGPFVFSDDKLRCGSSVSVACVEVTGGDVTITGSKLVFPSGSFHEAVYDAAGGSALDFENDTVSRYGSLGTVGPLSSVTVQGGVWIPYASSSASAMATTPAEAVQSVASSQTVELGEANVTVSSSSTKVAPGTPVTLTANVSPELAGGPAPTGSVTFTFTGSGSSSISCTGGDTQTLSSASTSCQVPAGMLPPSGTKYKLSVQASYSGDANYATGEATLTQKVL